MRMIDTEMLTEAQICWLKLYLWWSMAGLEQDLIVQGLPEGIVLSRHTELYDTGNQMLTNSFLR